MAEASVEIYSDRYQASFDGLAVVLHLLKSGAPKIAKQEGIPIEVPTPEIVATVRMPVEAWKLMLMLGRKSLKGQEVSLGYSIALPKMDLQRLQLTDADW